MHVPKCPSQEKLLPFLSEFKYHKGILTMGMQPISHVSAVQKLRAAVAGVKETQAAIASYDLEVSKSSQAGSPPPQVDVLMNLLTLLGSNEQRERTAAANAKNANALIGRTTPGDR